MWRPLGVIYRRGRSVSPAHKAFVALLKEPRWLAEEGLRDGDEALLESPLLTPYGTPVARALRQRMGAAANAA
jgi:hypothetical protein